MDEELVVGIVLGVDLVVELDHVEINETAYFLVDSDVASVLVVFIFEVGGLGGVAEDVVGYLCPDCPCEFYDPVLSLACVHGFVVLPVYVASIQIVVPDELPELLSALSGVLPQTGRHLAIPKGTDHDFDPRIIVPLLDGFLY